MASTKDKIIEIVIELLKNNVSFDDISMNKVAENVGIGKSTIYEYFESKNDLLSSATLRLADCIISDTSSFDIDKYNFKESFIRQILALLKLREYKNFAFEFFKNNHNYLTEKKEVFAERLKKITDVLKDRFTIILDKGITEKLIIKDNYYGETNMIKSLIIGAIVSNQNEQEDENLSVDVYNTILKLCN